MISTSGLPASPEGIVVLLLSYKKFILTNRIFLLLGYFPLFMTRY